MATVIVIASSTTDAGISCWEFHSGVVHLRFKSCSSPPHGHACVAGRFLASSQLRDPKSSSSGSILYWSWNKPQVEVRSFPAEPIKPLASNGQGTFIVGGGVSGYVYFWEEQRIDVFGRNCPGPWGACLLCWWQGCKAITCLASSTDAFLLVSGSEDGMIRVWDTRARSITRVFRHAKGPVNNVLVIRQSQCLNSGASTNSVASPLRRHILLSPPPLGKNANFSDEDAYVKAFIGPQNASNQLLDSLYISVQTMENQIKQLEQQGSSAGAEVDVERLKSELQLSVQMIHQWKRMYENLHQFCVK